MAGGVTQNRNVPLLVVCVVALVTHLWCQRTWRSTSSPLRAGPTLPLSATECPCRTELDAKAAATASLTRDVFGALAPETYHQDPATSTRYLPEATALRTTENVPADEVRPCATVCHAPVSEAHCSRQGRSLTGEPPGLRTCPPTTMRWAYVLSPADTVTLGVRFAIERAKLVSRLN